MRLADVGVALFRRLQSPFKGASGLVLSSGSPQPTP